MQFDENDPRVQAYIQQIKDTLADPSQQTLVMASSVCGGTIAGMIQSLNAAGFAAADFMVLGNVIGILAANHPEEEIMDAVRILYKSSVGVLKSPILKVVPPLAEANLDDVKRRPDAS